MSSAALKATDAKADVASGNTGFEGLSPLFESARVSVRTACAALEPDSLSGPEAVSVLTSVVEMLRVATSAKLALASRINATGVARESGYRNAAAQLADIEGVGLGAASATLLTAERLRECPAVGEAMANGELSEQQAKTIAAAAVLAPDHEDQLVESAHRKSVGELGNDCRRIRAAAANADPMATYQAIHAARSVRHWCDEQGALCLQGRFTPDVGAKLVASLDRVANEFFEAARTSGSKAPLDAYRSDALAALVTGERDPSHSGATINVRVDHDALLRGYPVGGEVSEIEESGPVPIPKVIDLMSDAGINVIFSHGDDISRIYHFTRTINASLLCALQARDRTCVVPRCGASRYLEIDHLVPFIEGGPTTISNLARLCSFHHSQKTNEGYTLWLDQDEQWHFDPPPPFGQEPGLGADLRDPPDTGRPRNKADQTQAPDPPESPPPLF
jgi:hypothetical protein